MRSFYDLHKFRCLFSPWRAGDEVQYLLFNNGCDVTFEGLGAGQSAQQHLRMHRVTIPLHRWVKIAWRVLEVYAVDMG